MELLGHPFEQESGPRKWANHKLFEAVRPSFYDLANAFIHGSKDPCRK